MNLNQKMILLIQQSPEGFEAGAVLEAARVDIALAVSKIESPAPISSSIQIKDAVEIYINDIIPLQKIIRDQKYMNIEILKNKESNTRDSYKLITQRETDTIKEYIEEEGQIIMFTIKK